MAQQSSSKKFGIARVRELLTLPSAEPMYVLNILNYADFKAYRWYGVTVLPALKLAGGEVLWSGHPIEMLQGQAQCQSLLVVRYPSHRHFVRMIANPYYAAINKIREKAVARFEGAFSENLHSSDEGLSKHRQLLVLHFNNGAPKAALKQAETMLSAHGAQLQLALSQYLALDLLPRPKATDPNPLTFQRNLFFSVENVSDELRASLSLLAADLGDCCFGLYKRSKQKSYLPGQPVPDYVK